MADERFAALSKDPRYRFPSRKEARTAVDPRFGSLFKDQDFRQKASVDRYGRKIKSGANKKELERLYRREKPEKLAKEKTISKGKDVVGGSEEESESDDEDDEDVVATGKHDPARQGGFSESSSEEETSDEDSEEEIEAELAEDTAGQEQTETIEMGEVTRRVAAVNLDWDHIRAMDIMAVAASFAPTGGKVEKVVVYPSEFGRERMEKEELEGPPREIFVSSKRTMESEEQSEGEDDDETIRKRLIQQQAEDTSEFDTAKLRQYQLDRLRYYYAVIECDSKITAKALYDQMDGSEYLTTANFFDLRFIPDDTSFEEDTPREECQTLPDGYKPNDFKTEALTHSKVRLTWDDDDTTRKEIQKRAFSRAEMDENDLQTYIGSDSSDAESIASRKSATRDRVLSKQDARKQKMRAALGLAEEPTKRRSKDEPVGDMQITFTSGLGADQNGKSVFENGPQDEESTRARYLKAQKERRQRRKENLKAVRDRAKGEEKDAKDADGDQQSKAGVGDEEDDPFNDPFFNDPAAAAIQEKNMRKAEKDKKRAAKAAQEAEAESRRAELELLMADDGDENGVRHFDMREIEKAEKEAKRKGRKGKKSKKSETQAVVDDFTMETQDPRFDALFQSHEYAIDPTNPRFKGTAGMKALLEEGRRKRKRGTEDLDEMDEKKATKTAAKGKHSEDGELNGLVARLKEKKRNKKS